MPLLRANNLSEIRLAFSVLQDSVRMSGKLNLTDIHISSEDFVCEVLNRTFGWNLLNANGIHSNYPCIDLIDADVNRKIGVQVTAEKGVGKIRAAHACCGISLENEVDTFYVIELLPKQASYYLKNIPNKPKFNQAQILDFGSLLKHLQKAKDPVVASVHGYVTGQMPRLFQTENGKDQALYDSATKCLNVLNREVLRAPAQFEEPCRMFDAICDIRIELQKLAAIYIASSTIAEEFKKITDTLRDCEYRVKREFKILESMSPGQRILSSAYLPGEWQEAIETMMSIRRPIEKSIVKIEAERKVVGLRLGY